MQEIIRGQRNIRSGAPGMCRDDRQFRRCVHHGHQLLLAHLNAKRDELAAPSVLITFEPLPREYFGGGGASPGRSDALQRKGDAC
mgnify:CR=1 FL=1